MTELQDWAAARAQAAAALAASLGAVLARQRIDVAIAIVLMGAGALASFTGSGFLPHAMLSKDAIDVWFDSDLQRVFDNMVSTGSDNKRADVHPLFAPIGFAAFGVVQTLTGLDDWTAVRVVLAFAAAISISLLYTILRCLPLDRLVSVLFTLLAGVSAASMFWYVVPETMPFGAVTILAGVLFALLASRHATLRTTAWGVAINLVTLSVTITNWAVGLLATLALYNRSRWILIGALTVTIAVVLTAAQMFIFPRAVTFGISGRMVSEEIFFIFSDQAGSPISFLKGLIFHGMVMPRLDIVDHYSQWTDWRMMRAQTSPVGSGSALGPIAVALWIGLLGLGAYAAATTRDLVQFRLVLGGAIVAQLALHSGFGRETFLYSPHFLPLLLILAAFGAQSRWRLISISLALGLLVTAGVNNFTVWRQAIDFVQQNRPQLAPLRPVADLSRFYADAPTPSHHVRLQGPNGETRGLVGQGGSLVVGDNAFVVALLSILDDEIAKSSDTHWATNTQQRVRIPWDGPSSVETDNWYYRVTAQAPSNGNWTLNITHEDNRISRVSILIRSAGAPHTPLRSISWTDNGELWIDQRWRVVIDPLPISVLTGPEAEPHRFSFEGESWANPSGAGFAVMELGADQDEWRMTIEDTQSTDQEAPTP